MMREELFFPPLVQQKVDTFGRGEPDDGRSQRPVYRLRMSQVGTANGGVESYNLKYFFGKKGRTEVQSQ